MKERIQFDFNVDIKKAIEEYEKRKALIGNAIKDFSFPGVDINGDYFDKRDLSEMIFFMPIVGKDDNEKTKCIQNNFKDLIHAFVSNDKDDIGVYMDIMYSNFDKLQDYYKNGINTIEDFINYQFLFSAEQSMHTKRQEYPDLFYKHYNNEEKLKKYVANSYFSNITLTDIARLKQDNPNLSNKSGFTYEMADEMFKNGREFTDAIIDALDNKTNIVEVTNTAPYLETANKKLYRVDEEYSFNKAIFNSNFINDITGKELKLGFNTINTYKLTFINGKPIYDMAKEVIDKNYKNANKATKDSLLNKQCIKYLHEALANGDKAITYAIPKTINGKIDFSLIKLKPNVKPQEQVEKAKHSAFRLKYFNWGPFKIKPSQDIANELASSTKYDQSILDQASKTYNGFIKECEISVANQKPTDKSENIKEANEYLLKENNIDLQKDTNLEKSSEVEPMKENPKEKEINIEIDTKFTNLE